jgi:hypothetical protein
MTRVRGAFPCFRGEDSRVGRNRLHHDQASLTTQVGPKMPGCPEWCPVNHFGFLRSGKMKVKYQDGTDALIVAGESYNIPPGHLPEVVSDEACVMVEFSQSTAEAIATMKE